MGGPAAAAIPPRERSRSPPPSLNGNAGESIEEWCESVLEDWRRLEHAPDECRSDPELICEATRLSAGEALRFASDKLRADAEFVLGAAKEIGVGVIEHAAASLRTDRDFMMQVIDFCSPGEVLQYINGDLRNELLRDRHFVLEAVREVGAELLGVVAEELRDDREFVLSIADYLPPGEVLEHASQRLQAALYSDRQFVLQALQGSGVEVLEVASEDLRSERDFMLEAAAAAGPLALEYASQDLRSSGDFMLAASQSLSCGGGAAAAGVPGALPAELAGLLADMGCSEASAVDYWVDIDDDGGGFWDVEGLLSDYQLACAASGLLELVEPEAVAPKRQQSSAAGLVLVRRCRRPSAPEALGAAGEAVEGETDAGGSG